MRRIFFPLFSILFLALFVYILLPSPSFPLPPQDALQSKEPADSETPLRRAYFTNLTREEAMKHYLNQFNWGLRLNYPPEESAILIRDQTKSTFLEEIVHPLRESIYINGYEPKEPQNAINIAGLSWRQKIIVRYVPSNVLVRITTVLLTSVCIFILGREWLSFFKND
jgi:hypothetical protein